MTPVISPEARNFLEQELKGKGFFSRFTRAQIQAGVEQVLDHYGYTLQRVQKQNEDQTFFLYSLFNGNKTILKLVGWNDLFAYANFLERGLGLR